MDAGGFPPNLIPMLGHVGVPEDAVHNQYMIDHAGRIPYLAFKVRGRSSSSFWSINLCL